MTIPPLRTALKHRRDEKGNGERQGQRDKGTGTRVLDKRQKL
jgi:hypothetical protein